LQSTISRHELVKVNSLSSRAGTGSLANVESSVDEVMLDNSEEHADVVLGERILTEVLSCGGVESGAVVVADVVVDGDRTHLHHRRQTVHLAYTFLA